MMFKIVASILSVQGATALATYAYVGFVFSQILAMYIAFSVALDATIQSAPPGFADVYYVVGLGIMAKMFFTSVTSGISVRLSRRPLIALLQAFGAKT